MITATYSPPIRASRRPGLASRAGSRFSAAVQGRLGIVWDPLRVLLFVLTVLTVSRIHHHYPQLLRLRPALLLVIVAAGYAYLNPRYLTRVNVFARWPMRLVALLGVLACCSAVFGISLGRTASFILGTYSKVLLYAFLLALSIRSAKDLFTFVWAYVTGCGILAFFSLFVFGISKSTNSEFARLGHLYTYDANDLGVVMMVGLPLTLLLLVSTRGSRRAFLLLILVGIAATIARSGSRGGFLGFVVVGAAALILADTVPVARRAAIMVAAVLALILGAPSGYWKQMGTMLEPKSDYNYSTLDGRKALAERGMEYMATYPVFGLGMNNFARAECTISRKRETFNGRGPIRCRAPHNSYIEAGAELGIPGLITWVSLVVGVIVGMLRLRSRLPRSWRDGTEAERFMYGATTFFPLSMIGFAVTAFFVSFAWMDPVYIMAAFTAGLYAAVGEPYSRPFTAREPGWRVARSARNVSTALAQAGQ